MKLILSVVLVIGLLFLLYIAACATLGILIHYLVMLAIAAVLVAVVRSHLANRQEKSGHAKAHTRAEKEAERKLKEMERNL